MSGPTVMAPATRNRFRTLLKTLRVPAYLAALILAFPLFDGWYSEGVSHIRVLFGKLAVSTGIAPEGQQVMLGIFKPEVPYVLDDLRGMERHIGTRFDILSFYSTWGDRDEDQFPIELLRAVDDHGAMAMITWEPWTSEFAVNAGRSSDALRTDLAEISAGRYDAYIRSWAREAVIFGKPFFLRFAHEMNNPQYPWSTQAGNTAEEFIRAWRHVWTLFREEGAENVLWVWSPKREAPRELYPGGEYVDWVGTGVFNYGIHGDGWFGFEYLYESVYRSVVLFDKPVMIAELGSVSSGGSRPDWFADAFRKIAARYPATRAVVLFNNPADQTLPGMEMDWSVEDDATTLDRIAGAVQDGIVRN
ncbi:MAG: glycosyl hydrolase [Bacteroidota bacterium]|nr:glycosyl hydrolase [Bacteroidota bacterium]